MTRIQGQTAPLHPEWWQPFSWQLLPMASRAERAQAAVHWAGRKLTKIGFSAAYAPGGEAFTYYARGAARPLLLLGLRGRTNKSRTVNGRHVVAEMIFSPRREIPQSDALEEIFVREVGRYAMSMWECAA